jgi:hypothetical protein
MREPADRYEAILIRAGLESQVAGEPQVFVTLDESWANLSIRYLVGARERRVWKTELSLAVADELAKPEHAGRIIPMYPRRQIQMVDADGRPLPTSEPDRESSDG